MQPAEAMAVFVMAAVARGSPGEAPLALAVLAAVMSMVVHVTLFVAVSIYLIVRYIETASPSSDRT
jgi:hypothetical protein